MSGGILAGMRLIEASAFVAAPLGGMTLAQMGADVIRIDLPGGGLDFRRWPVTPDNHSLYWCGLNKAKRSVCIDFSRPEGRDLAMALITAPGEDAGLLLTNLPPRGWLSRCEPVITTGASGPAQSSRPTMLPMVSTVSFNPRSRIHRAR